MKSDTNMKTWLQVFKNLSYKVIRFPCLKKVTNFENVALALLDWHTYHWTHNVVSRIAGVCVFHKTTSDRLYEFPEISCGINKFAPQQSWWPLSQFFVPKHSVTHTIILQRPRPRHSLCWVTTANKIASWGLANVIRCFLVSVVGIVYFIVVWNE